MMQHLKMVSYEQCTKVINDQLNNYNENHPVMNLVLFKDVIDHVYRISRSITSPNGHMLLVCLGGSGKQSLVLIAADLVCYGVFQITLANNYGVAEFNANLIKLFIQTGGKKNPIALLLTDSKSSTSFQLVSFHISSNKKIRNSYIQPSRET